MKICECGICGREVTSEKNRFINGHQWLGRKHTPESKLKISSLRLSEVVQNKYKQTMIERYGKENPSQVEEFKQKKRLTCQENYHTNNPQQSMMVQEKTAKTNTERYGGPSPMCSKEVQEKGKQTNLRVRGVEYAMQDPLVQKKGKQTYKEKTGYNDPMQNPEVQEKYKQESRKNWNTDYPSQSEEVQEKIKHTNRERRNVDFPLQDLKVREKMQDTMILKYGTDHWAKTPQGRLFHRENSNKRIETQKFHGEPMVPGVSSLGRECLDILEKETGHKILREQCILGYFLDGIAEGTKKVIEFDGRHNYKDNYITLTDHDYRKQKELENLGYEFFRIKQPDWSNNKQKIIDSIKSFLLNSTNKESFIS